MPNDPKYPTVTGDNMKKALLYTILMLAVLTTGLFAAVEQAGKITDITAYDMPDDDGSGAILRWKPLSKDHRIIKYNVYRGVSPDSLYLLTFLEVDPKMGVLAPYLYYYDTGDQPLIEFESSPLKLRKEKGQAADSPLYQKFPIRSDLLSSVMNSYSLLAMTKGRTLHHKSKAVTKDDKLMTGLKLVQTDGIYAIPKAGTKYYYSVAAVNERGQVLPASKVLDVVPTDNPPNDSAIVHAVYLSDKGSFNFEWMPPTGSSDIASWQGWLAPKSLVGTDGSIGENALAAAIPIFEIPNMAASSVYYHSAPFEGGGIDLANYSALLSYRDYSDQMAVVSAKSFRVLSSDALPTLPDYQVMDKINDKGDNMLVSFGKPLAYITLAEFKNHKHKSLKINYDVSKNENYTVDKVKFVFSTKDGKKIGEVIENYVDHVIELKLPEGFRDIRFLHSEISVKLLKGKSFESETVSQDVVYNDYFRRFQASANYVNGVDISKLHFDVLSMSRLDFDFVPGLRSNALTRTYDHTIPYEDAIFRPISGYDAASGRFLFDARLGIAADPEQGLYFDVPLYRDAFAKEMEQRKARIAEVEKQIAENPVQAEELSAELTMLKAEWDFITKHPAYLEAQKATSDKAWRKIMLSWRDKAMRSYQYRILATDTKAAFTVSDTYTDENGEQWFYPVSQWFDSTKWMTLWASILIVVLLLYAIYITRRREVYIRPIAGLEEIDNSIGRATEMGRPVMFVPGWGTLGDVCTIASLMILAQVSKKTAEYDTRLINPHCDYMVLPLAQEIISNSYSEMGRPDSFNQNDIFFVSYDQFPFCAGVNGITIRERVATIFYMGFFNAEALLLTETGNQTGAIQVAATDAITQIPFFITTCDYTLIGEEFYAASAYLSHDSDMVSMLKAQDYFKIIIVFVVLIGAILSTFNFSHVIHAFPLE
jgi:hypothetical protein